MKGFFSSRPNAMMGIEIIDELFKKLKRESKVIRTYNKKDVVYLHDYDGVTSRPTFVDIDGFFSEGGNYYGVVAKGGEVKPYGRIQATLLYSAVPLKWNIERAKEQNLPTFPFNKTIHPYGEFLEYDRSFSTRMRHKSPDSDDFVEVPKEFVQGNHVYDKKLVDYVLPQIKDGIAACTKLKQYS